MLLTLSSLLYLLLSQSLAVRFEEKTSTKPKENDPCDPEDFLWYEVEGVNTQFLYCNKNSRVFVRENCAMVHGEFKIFVQEYQQCVPPRRSVKKAQAQAQQATQQAGGDGNEYKEYIPDSFLLHVPARSGRVGDACNQNTDCLDGMYCDQGQCTCLSNYVQRSSYCYQKINPTQSECLYDEQCNAVWPGATCTAQACACPTPTGSTTAMRAAQTRDGYVCLLGTTSQICPLPQDLEAVNVLYWWNGGATVANSIALCNPQATTTTGVSTVAGTLGVCATGDSTQTTPTTGGTSQIEMYDCIPDAGTNPTTGVCCPNRAFVCAVMPVAAQENPGGSERWYFNPITQACSTFQWSSTAPNIATTPSTANNFRTLEHCQTYCKDWCPRGPPQYTTTTATTTTTLLNQQAPISCTTSGCDSNHECSTLGSLSYCCPTAKYVCARAGGLSATQFLAAQGNFATGVPRADLTPVIRYYYDITTATCTTFTWNGQGGNYNNFRSKADCETFCARLLCDQGEPIKDANGNNQACSSNGQCPSSFQCTNSVCCARRQTVCEMPRQVGTCNSYTQRYWFNAVTKECELFTYSGCQGNANNFRSLLSCQNYCRNTQAKPNCIQGNAYKDANGNYYSCSNTGLTNVCPVNYECYFDGYMWGCCPVQAYTCALTSNTGITCGPKVVKWYYDTTTTACQTIEYNGCDGNSNNFPTRDLCQDYCGVGGCPNGGVPLREGTGAIRICSAAVTCPSAYECISLAQSNSIVNYCCPTKAYVCSLPPYSGSDCGSTSITRYYFNLATRTCMTFDYYGCGGNGNNFATLSQCNNFCNSAACLEGEQAYLNPNSQQVLQCNPNLNSSCPTSYTCRYDSLTTRYMCCGATNMGVCPTGEKAYVNVRTNSARTCRPNVVGSCPSSYTCRFNSDRNTYFCCASISGAICPAGKSAFRQEQTSLPLTCTLNSVVNLCPTGYSCQSSVSGTTQGYCCTVNEVCPGGGEFFLDSATQGPRLCSLGLQGACPTTYSCIAAALGAVTANTINGFCCRGGNATNLCPNGLPYYVNNQPITCTSGTSSCPLNYACVQSPLGGLSSYCCEVQQLGCPTNSYAYIENNNPRLCTIGNIAGCPTGYQCTSVPLFSRNQCCLTVTDSGVCPVGMIGYVPTGLSQPQVCALGQSSCPGVFTCQYSTVRQQFFCCAQTAGCPAQQVAYINPTTGQPQGCTITQVNACPFGYSCQPTTTGGVLCCGSGAVGPVVQQQTIAQTVPFTAAPFVDSRPLTCTFGQPLITNGQMQTCQGGQCPAGYQCENTRQGPLCCGQQIIATTVFPTPSAFFGQTCPGGSNVALDMATSRPLVCTGSMACPSGYACQYSASLRQYYCCSSSGAQSVGDGCPSGTTGLVDVGTNFARACTPGSIGACPSGYSCVFSSFSSRNQCCSSTATGVVATASGTGGCPRGDAYPYPGTGAPLACQPGDNCPSGYSCQYSSTSQRYQCCSGGLSKAEGEKPKEAENPDENELRRNRNRQRAPANPVADSSGPECLPDQKRRCQLEYEIRVGECCWLRLELGQPCMLNEQCSTSPEVSCRDNICKCPTYQVAFNNTCVHHCPPTHELNLFTRVCDPITPPVQARQGPFYPWRDDTLEADEHVSN